MTNVPVTDADREALWLRLLDSCKGGPQWEYARACEDADAQAIARARAEEREACAAVGDARAAEWRALEDQYRERGQGEFLAVACTQKQAAESLAAAIRARGEGGKA